LNLPLALFSLLQLKLLLEATPVLPLLTSPSVLVL
jgi:hypothetical protein